MVARSEAKAKELLMWKPRLGGGLLFVGIPIESFLTLFLPCSRIPYIEAGFFVDIGYPWEFQSE